MAGTFEILFQKIPLPTLLFKLFHPWTPLKSQTSDSVEKKKVARGALFIAARGTNTRATIGKRSSYGSFITKV